MTLCLFLQLLFVFFWHCHPYFTLQLLACCYSFLLIVPRTNHDFGLIYYTLLIFLPVSQIDNVFGRVLS